MDCYKKRRIDILTKTKYVCIYPQTIYYLRCGNNNIIHQTAAYIPTGYSVPRNNNNYNLLKIW